MSHMYCCAKWCSTSGKSGEHLFRFPSDHRFSIWLKYANRLELLETPREKVYKTYRLCSKHFTRDCFTSDACTRLTHEAVPSVKVHEPRLRALVHPDFYEEGAAQGIESASPLQSTAAPVEVMLGHDYLPLPSTLGLGTIAGADSAVHDTGERHPAGVCGNVSHRDLRATADVHRGPETTPREVHARQRPRRRGQVPQRSSRHDRRLGGHAPAGLRLFPLEPLRHPGHQPAGPLLYRVGWLPVQRGRSAGAQLLPVPHILPVCKEREHPGPCVLRAPGRLPRKTAHRQQAGHVRRCQGVVWGLRGRSVDHCPIRGGRQGAADTAGLHVLRVIEEVLRCPCIPVTVSPEAYH
ncbi:uncharacterized protein LOC144105337 isoform X2 [Amblyomma americanum]